MIYNTLHNRWLRLVAAVAGELICAVGEIGRASCRERV